MKFAIINTDDGTICQINEAFTAETLAELNDRLPEGQQAIECGVEVQLDYKWNSVTETFEPPE